MESPYKGKTGLKRVAFDLPCLNHACDEDVKVMSDLFGTRGYDRR
jgi:hypothetical protein